jgi:methyl coenzyme M reductase subunit D
MENNENLTLRKALYLRNMLSVIYKSIEKLCPMYVSISSGFFVVRTSTVAQKKVFGQNNMMQRLLGQFTKRQNSNLRGKFQQDEKSRITLEL